MKTTTFDGFGADGLAVLAGLERTNTKAYFEAHRDAFTGGVVEPARALVVELGQRLRADVAPALVADPRINGSLFRINRDLRFSSDPSPYKTHQALYWWEGSDKKSSPGFYLSVSGREVGLGAGFMAIADLDRWRAAIADDTTGPAFTDALRAATDALPGAGTNEPDLKRVPSPYPADHPRGRWLRHKTFHASVVEPLPAEATSAAFVEWCAVRFEAFGALHRWLVDHAAAQ